MAALATVLVKGDRAGLEQLLEKRGEADELETYFRGRLEFPFYLPSLVSSSSLQPGSPCSTTQR